MLISQNLKIATDQYIQQELDSAHIQLLESLTVRLHGTVGRGNKAGTFTGSGVIIRVAQSAAYVLTAKHNLHIAAKDAGIGKNDFADYFAEKISVEVVKKNGGTLDGAISAIHFPDGTIDDEKYDVAVLEVGGVKGLSYANNVRSLLSGFTYYFTSMAWQHGKSNFLFDLLSREEAKAVLMNGKPYNQVISELAGFSLLHLGFGKVTTGGLYGFRRRVLKIGELVKPTFMDKTKEGYVDVFTYGANANDTALEGDSGGPIFAIDASGTRSYLIGFHLGANHYSDRVDNSNGTDNNSFTVVSSESLG